MDGQAEPDFEAELESVLGKSEPLEQGETSRKPSETLPKSEESIEAGGRKFANRQELAKSYGSLLKEYTRIKQDHAKAKGWMEFDDYLQKNPELQKELKSRVDEYVTRRQKGQQSDTAAEKSGIPDELAQRVDAIEARWEDMQLQKEMDELRSKYKIDDSVMDRVLRESAKYDGIALEAAYKQVMFDQVKLDEQGKAEKRVQDDLAKKREANVGSSSAPNVVPSKKEILTEADFHSALDRELEQFGIK